MKIPRIYADTSVIGGCLDPEFARISKAFLDMVREGEIILIFSEVLADELAAAPSDVRACVADLPPDHLERMPSSDETRRLRDSYLTAGVVSRRHDRDAHHIAHATVARADLMVSWNFHHIVQWD